MVSICALISFNATSNLPTHKKIFEICVMLMHDSIFFFVYYILNYSLVINILVYILVMTEELPASQ